MTAVKNDHRVSYVEYMWTVLIGFGFGINVGPGGGAVGYGGGAVI